MQIGIHLAGDSNGRCFLDDDPTCVQRRSKQRDQQNRCAAKERGLIVLSVKTVMMLFNHCVCNASASTSRGRTVWDNGDFIGFVLDTDLQQGLLTVMSTKGKQVGSRLIRGSCSANHFAIQRDWLRRTHGHGGTNPTPQQGFQGIHVQLWKQPSVQGSCRAKKSSCAKETFKLRTLALAPLAYGFAVVAIAKECSNQAGE